MDSPPEEEQDTDPWTRIYDNAYNAMRYSLWAAIASVVAVVLALLVIVFSLL